MVMTPPEKALIERLVAQSLEEDLAGQNDITCQLMIPESARGQVNIVSRQRGVLAGLPFAANVFMQLDPDIEMQTHFQDGQALEPGTTIATLSGRVQSLLTGERTALNFLTCLSGTASLTQQFVSEVAQTRARIYDTRKTLPGLRVAQKYAVRCGGGQNHRMGLFDAVLVKDNHLAWYFDQQHSLADAVEKVRSQAPAAMIVQFEVDSLDQLREILPAKPDIVLLDNMTPDQLCQAVTIRDEVARNVELEASGGVTLETVIAIAESGVDRISVGALTHSAPALDIAFDWEPNS